MTSHAIKAQFERAGVFVEDVQLDIAIAKYLNNGGTIDRGIARFEMARERLLCGDLPEVADQGQEPCVSAQQHDDRSEQKEPANQIPIVASPTSGGGHTALANHLRRAPAAREQSFNDRAASLLASKAAAVTIFDTLKIDGRSIGDWTIAEARRAGRAKTRDGHMLLAAASLVANAPSDARLRDVVKIAEMQRIHQKAEEIADAG